MDVDGTLVTGDKASIDNVLVQLRRLRPLGVRFSLATGRTIRGANTLAQQLLSVRSRMPPTLTYNGQSHVLDRDVFSSLVRISREQRWYVRVYACPVEFRLDPSRICLFRRTTPIRIRVQWSQIRFVDDLLAVDDDFIGFLIDIPAGSSREKWIDRIIHRVSWGDKPHEFRNAFR
jgi:hypothetical protein